MLVVVKEAAGLRELKQKSREVVKVFKVPGGGLVLKMVLLVLFITAAVVVSDTVCATSPPSSASTVPRILLPIDGLATKQSPVPVTFTQGRYRVSAAGDAFEFDWPAVQFEASLTCHCDANAATPAVDESDSSHAGGVNHTLAVALTFASTASAAGKPVHEFDVRVRRRQRKVATTRLTTRSVPAKPATFIAKLHLGLSSGRFRVVVQKRTEPLFGVVSLRNVSVAVTATDAHTPPSCTCSIAAPQRDREGGRRRRLRRSRLRRIEFVGDSLTAGYGACCDWRHTRDPNGVAVACVAGCGAGCHCPCQCVSAWRCLIELAVGVEGKSPCSFSPQTENAMASYAGQLVAGLSTSDGVQCEVNCAVVARRLRRHRLTHPYTYTYTNSSTNKHKQTQTNTNSNPNLPKHKHMTLTHTTSAVHSSDVYSLA